MSKLERNPAIDCSIGLGYVGLPLAQAFSKNFKVIGFDTDENKVNHLNQQTISTTSTNSTELSTADCRLSTLDY